LHQWVLFEVYSNELAAWIVAGLLENEGVPAMVAPNGPIFGAWTTAAVLVPYQNLHTARWVLALSPPTDVELEFLATGKLPDVDGAE
jgi:hypothetical protein